MELRQLAYFVSVADEASFTKAAAKAHVAQPGVSAQVRQLERELGHALLDRAAGAVRLTEVGAAVLPYARAALGAVAGVRAAVDALTGLVRGHVTVGTVASISSPHADLTGLLAGFHEDHPGVEFTLTEANSDQLVEALRAGRLDVALISLGSSPLSGIAAQVVVDEPLVVVVGRSDPLASRATITLGSLRGRALISLPRGTGLRSCLDQACAAAGFRPHVAFEASNPRVLAQLAGRGLGVAVVPESVITAHPAGLHVMALTRPRLRGRIALAWRTEQPRSPAAEAFISHARTVLAPVAGGL